MTTPQQHEQDEGWTTNPLPAVAGSTASTTDPEDGWVCETGAFSAEQLEDRLAARYRSDASEILFGVRNDAGFKADRTADAIAIGLWPSTGCTLEGFEIKVSRGDWTRELKNGAKSEAFIAYVDFWWLVAPRAIVTDDELPPNWGLLVPTAKGLRAARPAKRLPDPLPMPRGMLAAFVKRASTAVARKTELAEAHAKGVEYGKRSAGNDRDWKARNYDDLRKKIDKFQAETGINIEHLYDTKELAQAYAMVRSGGHLDLARRLGYAANTIDKLAADLRATVTAIEGVATEPRA